LPPLFCCLLLYNSNKNHRHGAKRADNSPIEWTCLRAGQLSTSEMLDKTIF
jgi:hypothetical protein